MAVNWSKCPDVERIAAALIPERHPHLEENRVTIRWRFRDDNPRKGGEEVLYGVTRVGGQTAVEMADAEACREPADSPILAAVDAALEEAFSEETPEDVSASDAETSGAEGQPVTAEPHWEAPRAYFRVWVPAAVWGQLDDHGRRGLVDEILCNMGAGLDDADELKLTKVLPDFQGYCSNVADFGFWRSDLRQAARSFAAGQQLKLPFQSPRADVVGMGSIEGADGLSPFHAYECGQGHRWDIRVFGSSCPTCSPQKAMRAYESLNGAVEAVATETLPEVVESPEDLIPLRCGHEVERRFLDQPCPGCELESRLRGTARPGEEGGPPDLSAEDAEYVDPVTGEEQPAEPVAASAEPELIPGTRRKRRQHIPNAEGFREHVDAKRFGEQAAA